MKKNKWVVEVLLVVLIVGLGFGIFVLIDGGIFSGKESTSDQEPVIDAPSSDPADRQVQVPEQDSDDPDETEIAAVDFSLMRADGDWVSLSDHLGKVVIINFWATWCPPCRAEMPLFQEAAERYPDALVVLAVNSGEDLETIKQFSSNFSSAIYFLVDQDYEIGEVYRVRGLPTTYFIDPEGFIQEMHIGELTENLLATYLNRMGVE